MSGWIGVDLDGTLARNTGGIDSIGEPLEPLRTKVEQWCRAGIEVRIVTARVSTNYGTVNDQGVVHTPEFVSRQYVMIQEWLHKVGLPPLAVVDNKDLHMWCLIDDRAVRARTDTGGLCPGCEAECELPKITEIISNN